VAVIIALSSFALILISIGGGLFLRYKLPDSHLSGDSKDVIRLATALIGTMAAVVVALLFASTRSTYEATNSQVARLTAGVVELDQLLKEYGGAESLVLRRALRSDVGSMISAIWREDAPVSGELLRPVTQEETVLYKLRQLEPKTPVQTSIKARALVVSNDIEQTRLTLLSQPPDSLSRPFIAVLVLWLCFIFASFSMSSKANATLVTVLLICGFTAATAIYLILELGQPFDGLLQLSNKALRHVLPPLS
jgi:amino acid transporter